MSSFNKVIFMGRLTQDPDLRQTTSGKSVLNGRLAANDSYTRNNGERQEKTTFIDFTAWGNTAELIAKWKSKGEPILVEGRLEQDEWEDKQTNQKRSKIKIVVHNVTFVGSNGESKANNSRGETPRNPSNESDYNQHAKAETVVRGSTEPDHFG